MYCFYWACLDKNTWTFHKIFSTEINFLAWSGFTIKKLNSLNFPKNLKLDNTVLLLTVTSYVLKASTIDNLRIIHIYFLAGAFTEKQPFTGGLNHAVRSTARRQTGAPNHLYNRNPTGSPNAPLNVAVFIYSESAYVRNPGWPRKNNKHRRGFGGVCSRANFITNIDEVPGREPR